MTANDNHPPVPWWLWPNVLSLDAPVITLAWQELFARSAGCELRWPDRLALGLAVWVIYAADRVLDGIRLGVHPSTAARHRFGRKWAGLAAVVIAVAILAEGVVVLGFLPLRIIAWGAGLAALAGVYFLWNQLSGHRFGRGWLKEAVVSAGFAVGAALVPLVRSPSIDLGVEVAAFAVLCFTNCLLIARLDRHRDLERGEVSLGLLMRPGARPSRVASIAFGLAMLAWMTADGVTAVRLCLLGSAILIAAAGLIEQRWGEEATAVWADFALLTPLAALLVSGC